MRADAGQGSEVVALPWPAGGEVQRVSAGVSGEAAGDLQQAAAQRSGGAGRGVRKADELGPAQQVVGQDREDSPGAVGGVIAGGEVCERLVFEVGDDLLDDGVFAVLGLDDRDRIGAVGEKRVMTPVGE